MASAERGQLNLRIEAKSLERWKREAAYLGWDLSQWIRATLDARATRARRKRNQRRKDARKTG
jgi:predicted HicB family RNase H-like nuclease